MINIITFYEINEVMEYRKSFEVKDLEVACWIWKRMVSRPTRAEKY
jgi:hypothetical protein